MSSNSKSILLVDEDVFLLPPVARRLTSAGFDVVSLSDVDIAFETVISRRFDVVVFDLMMPTPSGFDVIETRGGFETGLVLAQATKWLHPETKIIIWSIATSGLHVPEAVIEGLHESGWLTFVAKQDNVEHLFDEITRLTAGTNDTKPPAANSYLDALKLEPSFMGVGVDLKKLARAIMGKR